MVIEVAEIQIHPGRNAEFDAAIVRGVAEVIAQAPGYLGHQVSRGLESPERYLLQIRWATLEHHTVGFRQSEAFAAWRAIVGPHFAQPPRVEHFLLVDPAP